MIAVIIPMRELHRCSWESPPRSDIASYGLGRDVTWDSFTAGSPAVGTLETYQLVVAMRRIIPIVPPGRPTLHGAAVGVN